MADSARASLSGVRGSTAAAVLAVPVEAPTGEDGICHTAADDAGLVALCGADISAHEWCGCPDGLCLIRQACVVCEDLDVEEDDVDA